MAPATDRAKFSPLFYLSTMLILLPGAAYGQSASTEVMPERRVYLEFDLNTHLEPHAEGGYQTYAPRVVYGLRKNVEIGLNLEASHPVVPDQGIELQPNVKWQFHNDETKGVAASVGAIVFVPIIRRGGTDAFSMIYTNVSKQIQGDYGPKFTGGAFLVIGRQPGFGSKGGAIVGYSQPLHRRIGFDLTWWSSSNDRFGYATPSLSFRVTRKSQVTIGYAFGNVGRKNNELALAYGIEF
ncbi:MAG TPA: hypothetical protein VJ302_27930 [Blastocatellia bacterium]|nr:hypothetical protein [Blastocatellia bacterium]